VLQQLKKVRSEMCFDGENESFNKEVIWNNIFIKVISVWNNIFIKGISVSLQNYKMFMDKPHLRYFPA
jgi:hypothetical protein